MANAPKTAAPKAEKKPETKRDKFVRLATARTNKALKAISGLGALANKSAYDFVQADVDAIEKALGSAADAVVTKFVSALAGKSVAPAEGFKLPGTAS